MTETHDIDACVIVCQNILADYYCSYLHHHQLLVKSWAVIAACHWNWHNGYLQSLDMEFSWQSDRYFCSICDIVCKLKNVYSWAFIVAVPSDFTNGDDKMFGNHADIWDSQADVLASMANYLKNHGWKNGGPLFQKVNFYRKFNIWAMWHTFWCLLTAWKTTFHISNSTTIHHEYYGYHSGAWSQIYAKASSVFYMQRNVLRFVP